MYQFQVALAAYLDWWNRRVSKHPRRWLISLIVTAILMTFLSAALGEWAFVFYPIGWVCILPGLFFANRRLRRSNDIIVAQRNRTLKTKKLIDLGKK